MENVGQRVNVDNVKIVGRNSRLASNNVDNSDNVPSVDNVQGHTRGSSIPPKIVSQHDDEGSSSSSRTVTDKQNDGNISEVQDLLQCNDGGKEMAKTQLKRGEQLA